MYQDGIFLCSYNPQTGKKINWMNKNYYFIWNKNHKVEDLNTNISTITLNVNDLNVLIKNSNWQIGLNKESKKLGSTVLFAG